MKTALFRAWLPESDEMIYINNYDGDQYHFSFSRDGIKVEYFDTDHVREGGGEILDDPQWTDVMAEISQFTGLKDKNGINIYGGDILENTKSSKGNFYVKFNCGGYDAVYKNNFTLCLHPVLSDFDGAIVIGNIYENPNLIQ